MDRLIQVQFFFFLSLSLVIMKSVVVVQIFFSFFFSLLILVQESERECVCGCGCVKTINTEMGRKIKIRIAHTTFTLAISRRIDYCYLYKRRNWNLIYMVILTNSIGL